MKNPVTNLLTALAFIITACSSGTATQVKNGSTSDSESKSSLKNTIPLRDKVLTAEEQKALTPDMVIQGLSEGNKSFMSNDLTARDHSAMVRNASRGQYPEAVILSCLDSRVPIEDVFNKGIGDLFVGRIAG